jgi:uncharacterized protein YecT (DUF1311 family)
MPSRRHRIAWAILAALFAASSAAIAQDADVKVTIRVSQDYTRCMDAAAGVTPAMIECSGRETARWDQRLNAAYRGIAASHDLSERTKAEIRDAQRAWIAYRDKACIAAGDVVAEGGSLSRIVANDCFMRMTAQRAVEMEELASPAR